LDRRDCHEDQSELNQHCGRAIQICNGSTRVLELLFLLHLSAASSEQKSQVRCWPAIDSLSRTRHDDAVQSWITSHGPANDAVGADQTEDRDQP
jgi:hypothetical protein